MSAVMASEVTMSRASGAPGTGQRVHDEASGHDTGDPVRVIVAGRDFHHVHPDYTVSFGDLLEYGRNLTIQEASGGRRHDAGHLRRVDAVGIDRDVNRYAGGDGRQGGRPPVPNDLSCREYPGAVLAGSLYFGPGGTSRLTHAQLRHTAHKGAPARPAHGTGVTPPHPFYVFPPIQVRIDMHDMDWLPQGIECVQYRNRDSVVATEHEHLRVLLPEPSDMPCDGGGKIVVAALRPGKIAAIGATNRDGGGERVVEIEVPTIRSVGNLRRAGPDGIGSLRLVVRLRVASVGLAVLNAQKGDVGIPALRIRNH